MLDSPNINPKNAPYLGPSKIAPMITGIWIMVADPIRGIWGKPKGVKVKRNIIAINIPVSVMRCVLLHSYMKNKPLSYLSN